ncbi:MAG: ABC transporter permease subunit, partial [Halalkalicoccus sp.]|nr:ABC transporter permease subunit [Halalkalicoccus sp.]
MVPFQRNLPKRLERWLTAGLALGAVSLLVVLFYLPVGLVISEALGPEGRRSLDAFETVLTDPFYVGVLAEVFANPLAFSQHIGSLREWASVGFPVPGFGLFGFTAYQALLSTVASVLIGLPGAYVLSRFEFRGRRTLRSLTILPFVLPSIMVAVGFFAMFSAGGPPNRALGAIGLGPVSLLFTLEAIVLAHAFYNAPLVARIVAAAWESVDGGTIETARSLGASRRRAHLDVVAPQLLPATLVGAVLAFIFTFMSFPIVLALGGLELATVEVWVYDRVRNLAYTEAAALATLESLLSIALLYFYLRYEARVASASAGRPLPREPLLDGWRSLLRPSRLALAAYGTVVLVLFVGPIASLLLESLTNSSGFTLQHYAFLLERQASAASYQTQPLPAIRNSLVFAAGTLVLALGLGLGVAALSTGSLPGRTLLSAVAMLPLAVSGVVLGIGLLRGLVFGISLPLGYRFELTGP